jgi:hypothetical protein
MEFREGLAKLEAENRKLKTAGTTEDVDSHLPPVETSEEEPETGRRG